MGGIKRYSPSRCQCTGFFDHTSSCNASAIEMRSCSWGVQSPQEAMNTALIAARVVLRRSRFRTASAGKEVIPVKFFGQKSISLSPPRSASRGKPWVRQIMGRASYRRQRPFSRSGQASAPEAERAMFRMRALCLAGRALSAPARATASTAKSEICRQQPSHPSLQKTVSPYSKSILRHNASTRATRLR